MSTTSPAHAAALALLAAFAGPGAATAATVAALKDGTAIVWIDTDMRKATGTVRIDGGARLVGIDVRPADGKLYGLTEDGAVVTIDHRSGKWEKRSQLTETLPKGVTFTVDFNPAADRLRVLGSDGTSLRINVDDGKTIVDGRLRYADSDPAKGKQPRVTAGAYVNSFAGTKETTLYDIDTDTGTLVRQAPPNDGILNTIGNLGVKLAGPVAFDIRADGKGGNAAWMLTGGALYTVDLTTGAAHHLSRIEGLTGMITDMAVLPAS